MRWSKLKQRIEETLAPRAKGRVEFWATRYRKAHDQEGEAWITIDGQPVHSMGTLTHFAELYERCDQQPNGPHGPHGAATAAVVKEQLRAEGVLSLWEFNDALFKYLNMPFEQILISDHMLIRAVGMFDKRLGKRRLRLMDMSQEHALVQKFYRMRCAFEGIRIADTQMPENPS